MNLAGVAVAILAHAAAADEALTKSVEVEWFAVQATNEDRDDDALQFGEGLTAVREAIESFIAKKQLDLDTFSRIAYEKVSAPPNVESKLGINNRYTAFVKPLTRDDQGRIRITVRIEETVVRDGKKSVRDALNTKSSVAAKSPLLLGGLKLDRGNLIGAIFVSD